MSTKIFLTYCDQNQDIVQHFANDLSRAGLEFVHDSRQPDQKAAMEAQMSNSEAPIYLFVSDNFLKSVDCMEGALKFIDNFKFRPRIRPVVIPGVEINKAAGVIEEVPTKFDKVSNVIRYMNFWQDEYLRLRREKRTIAYHEEAAFQTKIDRIRRISNEIGEFLRSLRGFSYMEYEHLKRDSFKAFFDGLGFEGSALYARYRVLPELPFRRVTIIEPEPVVVEEEVIAEPAVADTPIETVPTPVSEVPTAEESQEEIIEDETPEVPVIDIPGINLLENASNEDDAQDEEVETAENEPEVEDTPEVEEEEQQEEIVEAATPEAEQPQPEVEPPFVAAAENDEEEEEEDEEEAVEGGIPSEEEEAIEIPEPADEILEEGEEAPSTEEEEDEDEDEGDDEDEDESEDEDEDDEDSDDEDNEEEEEELPTSLDESDEPEASPADELPVRTPQMILEEAQAAITTGNYLAAKENYELLLTNSDDLQLKMDYVSLLQDHLKDTTAAKEILEDLLIQDKADAMVHYRLGIIAEGDGSYQVAKNYYERAIAMDGKFADAYHSLGLIFFKHFENQDFVAKSYLQEAINIDSENSTYRHAFAELLSAQGEYKKARKQLIEAIDLDEDDAQAHFNLAELYLNHLNKNKKARKYYLKAVALDADYRTDENDAAFGASATDFRAAAPQPTTEVKTILVTGATSGIGLAVADAFAAQGHRVILTGRREERLENIQTQLKDKYGVDVHTLAFDVRDYSEAEQLLTNLPEAFKDVDILINNAGLAMGLAPIHEGSLEHWETMIDTNIKGLLYVTRLVSPSMVARKKGHIINIGSTAGKEVYPNGNVYCATKFAVDALTRGMRLDLHEHGIKVTAIHPGHVETEFALVRFEGDEEKAQIYNDFKPLTATDVAETVVFVATRPTHVNIQDILMYSSQQASSTVIDRSGRDDV